MSDTHDSLDEPLRLTNRLTLRGRTMLAPLTNLQSNSDGTLGEDEYRWLARRASSFDLASTCAAFVSEQGHAWDGQLGVASGIHAPGLARLAELFHSHQTPAIVQLHHGGAMAKLAPERISADSGDDVRAADEGDLEQVITDYVAAARRAIDAGFEGVEVHGANGYLFTQFLAPASNHRSDRWGGTIEGRARLLVDATRAVRSAIGDEPLLSVRISPVDTFDQRGLILDDALALADILVDAGMNMLHLSLGNASGPPPFEPDRAPVATALRTRLPSSVALAAAGGVTTREDALRVRSAGVDLVVLGRAAIAHPDWPAESRDPRFQPLPRPHSYEQMRSVAVSDTFYGYLKRFAGLVEGGEPPRQAG